MEKDLISVVIPMYNSEKSIDRCIKSIINQSYKNIEIIVIDDGSTDNSKKICEKLAMKDSRIKVLTQTNSGVATARNNGMKEAKGKYLCFIDSDDWIESKMIEICYNKLIKEKVDVIRCNMFTENGKDLQDVDITSISKKYNENEIKSNLIDKILNGKLSAYVWLLLIKKNNEIKNLRFSKDIIILEDTLFYIEMLLKVKSIYVLNKRLYHYCMNEEGLTLSYTNAENKIKGIIKYKKRVKKILIEEEIYNDEREKEINTVLTNFIMHYIYGLYLQKKDLKKIIKDMDIKDILKNINLDNISLYNKIQIKNIISENVYYMKLLFKLKKIIKRSKKIEWRFNIDSCSNI